ncbi:AraC family transcriptional regulator with amidase-like domain [Rhodobacter viridis]|uniref:AraC family transcriptional regulator with amidase-like domain n=1 Tax=Rhodobacter viridis TaxID=1054202 RepID=A0A318U198_9RHOB|nr:GlxA family transcriptional regulator [Rhodobacter viridis]PYF08185.1 AraC family transcriptional regulator with amidase-like domain [Rhodobacter viridis]
MAETAHFVFLLVENFSHLAFSCALEPLRIANLLSGQELYRWSLASEDGVSATCSNRSVTLVHRGLEPLDRGDRLFLISGIHVQRHTTPAILNYLRRERAAGTPIGAICSGAYVLAKAGFLDGVKTAIHWEYHDLFMEDFPEVDLVRNVFVTDAKFVTASGGTAAADLMLHLIALEHGKDLATAVADQMVYNAVREGTAAQRVSLQSRHGMRNDHMSRAIALMEAQIEEPMTPFELADRLGISTRQLERLFGKYLNTSPKRYMMEMRLHRARNLIVQTEQSISEIAMACGFTSTSHFSKVFRARYGVAPISHRATLG